ncbi:hypothetical protein JCM10908_003444 [Rhodotorula pacifica]|uniref:uncharacterized protein n=1 Tax=Rhodotorula pacifica TaxID=1495444 RepID=UPI0031775651
MPLPTASLPARPPTQLRLDSSFSLPPEPLGYHQHRLAQSHRDLTTGRKGMLRPVEPARAVLQQSSTWLDGGPRFTTTATSARCTTSTTAYSVGRTGSRYTNDSPLARRTGPQFVSLLGPSQPAATKRLQPSTTTMHFEAKRLHPAWYSTSTAQATKGNEKAASLNTPRSKASPIPFVAIRARPTRHRDNSDQRQLGGHGSGGGPSLVPPPKRFVPSVSYASEVIVSTFRSCAADKPFPPPSMPPAAVFRRSRQSWSRGTIPKGESKRLIAKLPSRGSQQQSRKRLEERFEFAPLPTRFRSENDPSPDWLREALYGPSFDDLQAIRGVVEEERRRTRDGSSAGVKRSRPIDIGIDFARWQTGFSRTREGKRRRL